MEEKKTIKISLKLAICIFIIILLIIGVAGIYYYKTNKSNNNEEDQKIVEEEKNKTVVEKTNGITVVPTMNDKITADSSWCGTFQLVWNDMKNEVVKQDVVFNPQLEMVENLNKEDFNESMLSEDYYFKIYGLKSLKLKEQIEKGIKEKFNQTSDILDDFNWEEEALNDPKNPDVNRYFFYTMLYRKFEFLKEFDKLDNDEFGNEYKDIKYFGIDKNTEEEIGDQIKVLYYNSKDDFAILINTKTDDEVIFCKNPQGSNFNEIYENMNSNANKYTGSKMFKDIDEFKAPNLEFNEKKEYVELAGKEFETFNGKGTIEKAMQTIKFSLNEKGGEIKSEAAIDMYMETAAPMEEEEKEKPRYFYVDDTFTIFLREKGKAKPYFAGRVDDITKYQ